MNPVSSDSALIPASTAFWSRRFGRRLSEEEMREATTNLVGFFEVISGWDRASSTIPSDEEGPAEPAERKPP